MGWACVAAVGSGCVLAGGLEGEFLEFFFDEGGVLNAGELGVDAFLLEQGMVVAAFDDAALVHDEDLVGVADGGKAVGDDDGGASGQEALKGLLNEFFRGGVHAGGGFVEDEDGAVFEQGAGDADSLFFADAELDAAFADLGVVAVGELGDEWMAVGGFGGGEQFGF